MFGAVLGKHKQISLKELELVEPENLVVHGTVAVFDTKKPEILATLGGIIKRGTIEKAGELNDVPELCGVSERALGKYLKGKGLTRRFKEVDADATDIEVREKGKEYILLGDYEELDDDSDILVVTGYQDISLYEMIDFNKPVNSMQIGMMPAKLALMMINIGLAQCKNEAEVTIYDPFVGLGTTAFLANARGYDCIISDIEITAAKQNTTRRQEYATKRNDAKRITLFKHDIYEPLKKPFLTNVNLIVTEGRLGPIITDQSGDKEIFAAQEQIVKLYRAFLENINTYYTHITAVFTMPIHVGKQTFVRETIEERCHDHNVSCEILEEIYKRPKQKIGRQIVILHK